MISMPYSFNYSVLKIRFYKNRVKNKIMITLTDANFDEKVLNANLPIVVIFHVNWSTPSRATRVTLENYGEEQKGKLLTGILDIDDNINSSQTYNIRTAPTLLFIKNGKIIDRCHGTTARVTIAAKVAKLYKVS